MPPAAPLHQIAHPVPKSRRMTRTNTHAHEGSDQPRVEILCCFSLERRPAGAARRSTLKSWLITPDPFTHGSWQAAAQTLASAVPRQRGGRGASSWSAQTERIGFECVITRRACAVLCRRCHRCVRFNQKGRGGLLQRRITPVRNAWLQGRNLTLLVVWWWRRTAPQEGRRGKGRERERERESSRANHNNNKRQSG